MKIYNKFLTLLLIILIVSLLGVLGYYFYLLYDNYQSNKIAEELIIEFSEDITTDINENTNIIEQIQNEEPNIDSIISSNESNQNNTSTSNNKGTYYNNYKVIGVIEIPSLKVKYPIFNVDNTKTLSLGTAAIYPMNVENAINKPGNVVIAGHNYRNNKMFSKIHTLKNGDLIYITDNNGNTVEYTIYNNYTADVSDFTYATRNVEEGVAEISLSTCTDNVNTRTVIWAKVQL